MKKLMMSLTAAALVLGSMALPAGAQTQQSGAATVHALAQNATPIVEQAACRAWGRFCGPGWTRRCGRWGCRCVPCW